jgi:hypothetical protein
MNTQATISIVLLCLAAGIFLQHFLTTQESYIAPTPAYIQEVSDEEIQSFNDLYVTADGPNARYIPSQAQTEYYKNEDPFTVVHSDVYNAQIGQPQANYDADLVEAAQLGTLGTIDQISGFHSNVGKMNI